MFRRDNLELLSPVIRLLETTGERYQKNPGQVALRWLIERGALPIPGAKNSAQAAQAAQNAGALMLAREAAEIDALDRASATWRR